MIEKQITIYRTGMGEQRITIGVYVYNTTLNEVCHIDSSSEIAEGFRVSSSALREADPITSNMSRLFSNQLKEFFSNPLWNLNGERMEIQGAEVIFVIGEQEIYVEKPYALNGTKMSLKEIGYKLSRITMAYGSIEHRFAGQEIAVQTKKAIRKILKTPEDILYCLENRTPYHFYEGVALERVRLNLKQVGPSEYALEIADGKWGPIKEKDLTTYLGHYLHGHRRGTWKFLSPKKLYTRIMGAEPKDSELKMMIAFLLQNRTQDLVEERAKKLIEDMAIQHSDRILVIAGVDYDSDDEDAWKPMKILVKGEKTDWLLKENGTTYSGDTQRVSTYCLMTETTIVEDGFIKKTEWYGPICIDTGGKDPSLGDQFASRILSLMNDASAAMRVSTISNNMIEQTDRIRLPLEEKYTNEGEKYEYNKLHGMSIQES